MSADLFSYTSLIKFYKNILKELKIDVKKFSGFNSLLSHSIKNTYFITFDNKQMLLFDEKYPLVSSQELQSIVFFHPLNNLKCSFLVLEDGIHYRLSKYVYKIFELYLNNKPDLEQSKSIDKYTFFKWNNLYNIISATSFSRNVISVSFSNNSNCANVKFSYPLYDYLVYIQNNTIFGIEFDNSEIKLFKELYENNIIKKLDEVFNKPLDIPKNSDKSPKFYVLIKLFQIVNEILEKDFNNIEKHELFNKQINNLNDFIFDEISDISLVEMEKIDKEIYENELEIRERSTPTWSLLKDNIVQQKQLTVQNNIPRDIEVLESFSNEEKFVQNLNNLIEFLSDEKAMINYKKSLNELISLGKKASSINRVTIQNKVNQKLEKENKLYDIYYWQKVTLDIINRDGICLWQDSSTEDYYFRAGINNKVKPRNKDKTSKKISAALNSKLKNLIQNNTNLISFAVEIKIVESVEEAYRVTEKSNLNNLLIICIFKQEIHVVEDEVFDIQNAYEFFKYYSSLNWTRNLFVHNNHLIKKHIPNNMNFKESYSSFSFRLNKKTYLLEKNNPIGSSLNGNLLEFKQPKFVNNNKESFIEQFIFYLVNENIDIFNYVMNWLAYFFQTLNKTSTTLVLLGDKDVSEEYFLNSIIKEIFGSKYCTTICDEEYKKPIISDIVKNKVFYHIGNIDNKKTKFDNKTLSKILKQLLLRQSVESKNKDNKHELVPIYGQTIITSDEAYKIAKPCFSKCTVIRVNDLETIIEKLKIPDEGILESKIQEDLELFSSILSIYPVNKDFAKYALNTEERDLNKKEELVIIDEKDSAFQVDKFINSFKFNKEDFLEYFEVLKDDEKLYNQLISAYEEGYYISQDLYTYFTKIYENHIYSNKSQFIKELKEKDDMFKQEIDTLRALDDNIVEVELFKAYKTSKEFDYKKLAKIKEYKLAKDILVPKGFIITNREGNTRFKYEYEDLETAKKMYAKYDKEQLEKKQNSK